jgi:hypothetical protein
MRGSTSSASYDLYVYSVGILDLHSENFGTLTYRSDSRHRFVSFSQLRVARCELKKGRGASLRDSNAEYDCNQVVS